MPEFKQTCLNNEAIITGLLRTFKIRVQEEEGRDCRWEKEEGRGEIENQLDKHDLKVEKAHNEKKQLWLGSLIIEKERICDKTMSVAGI